MTVGRNGIDKRRVCLLHTAVENDHEFCRQLVVVVRLRRASLSSAGNDVAQELIGRREHTGREIDRVTNRNEKLLLNDVYHYVTENTRASDPATSPVVRMIAA